MDSRGDENRGAWRGEVWREEVSRKEDKSSQVTDKRHEEVLFMKMRKVS